MPRHLSDPERTIRKKSDDNMLKYDPDYTSLQQDDYEMNIGAHEQQQQQPWRFILLNHRSRYPSKKLLKFNENSQKLPSIQQNYLDKKLFSNVLNDGNNNGQHIQSNSQDDYDFFTNRFDYIPNSSSRDIRYNKMNHQTN